MPESPPEPPEAGPGAPSAHGPPTVEQSELLHRSLIDGMLDPVLTIDLTGRILHANRAVEQAFGYTADDLVGRNIKLLMPEPYHSEHDGYLAHYRRTGETNILGRTREFQVLHRNGERRDVELSVSRVDPAGMTGPIFVGAFRDVTEKKRARRRETSMLRALASLGESTAELVHEIKNPITAVNMALRAVADQLGEDQEQVLGELVARMQKLETQMRQSLAFARPLELRPVHVEARALFEDVGQFLRPMLTRAGVALDIDVPRDMPAFPADPRRLEEVLSNLVANAMEMAVDGGRVLLRADVADRGTVRLRAGVQYVVYNLLGSTLFLFALGTIYAVTGTLNMADLALKVGQLPAEDTALIRVGAVLLLLVFAIKAALLPLHFWLPSSYANAPAPVAALFAIMTKVGAYAILRFYTLVFPPDLAITAGLVGDWLLPAALATVAVGMVGILGARQVSRMTAFAAIGSMGTLLTAISLFTPQATSAALYYIVHSTFATALMFLVADLVIERRGDGLEPTAPMPQGGLVSALFFAGAIASAGMPPLSGFVGKLLVLDASRGDPDAALIWAVILVSSLVAIIGLGRVGSVLFWKSHDATLALVPAVPPENDEAPEPDPPAPALPFVAVFAVLGALVLLTVLAGPMARYASATVEQLYDPAGYIRAVLKEP